MSKRTVTLYLDAWESGHLFAYVEAPGSFIPNRVPGVARYRVQVEIPDPHRPDAEIDPLAPAAPEDTKP